MPSSRNSYQRVNYRRYNDDGPSTSHSSVNEELNDFANPGYDDNEIEFEEISADEVDDLYTDVNIRYDDFDTIDWTRDRQQDRVRIRRMKKLKKGTAFERIREAHDA